MQLNILTPDKTVYEGEVQGVQLPGILGGFEILKGHAPLIAALGEGQIRVNDGSSDGAIFKIKGGIVEVVNNQIAVLVESLAD